MIEEYESNEFEKDALLSIIWHMGWTHFRYNVVAWKVTLIDRNKNVYRDICLHEYNDIISKLTFKRGSNLRGSVCTWVAESDGSAEMFRNLIKHK